MRTRRALVVRLFRGSAFAGLLAAAGLGGAVVPEDAHAQGADTEKGSVSTFSIGPAQRGFSIVEPPDGLPETRRGRDDDGSGSWFFRSVDRAVSPAEVAEKLYADALAALEDGRKAEAQRLFERLIASSTDSKFSSAAREHLGRLYSADRSPSGQNAKARETALPWSKEEQSAASPASLEIAPQLSRSTLLQARVAPAIDERFVSDVGDRVFFAAGSAGLGTRALGVLRAQARFLIQNPDIAAAVEGHADDGPIPDEETLNLSQLRAVAVRERLIAEGVAADRLAAYGRGREERVSDCPAPECLAQNRRAITVLLDGPKRFGRRPQGQDGPASAAPMASPPTQ